MQKNKILTNELHSKNFRKFGLDINVGAALTAVILITLFIGYSLFNYETIYQQILTLRDHTVTAFSWPMILVMLFSLLLVLAISFSPLGKIRIGDKDDRPEFKRISWYAMLFGAGMGIGFMFWGVAEPLVQEGVSPLYSGSSPQAQSIATTFLHWGLMPWSIYSIISLSLAYYAYNLKLPLAPRSLFYPFLKNKIYGLPGDIIDGFSVLLTLFALSSSLGMGSLQVNAGFNYLFGLPMSTLVQVLVILFVTFLATLSLISGLKKGIRMLSEFNLYLSFFIVGVVFILGPTTLIITGGAEAFFVYVQNIVSVNFTVLTASSEAYSSLGYNWAANWTLFYWAWWIGWAIFVGMFIAKISKGRTIRDFLLSVTIIPTVFSIIWFSIFGITAMTLNGSADGSLLATVSSNEALSLYALIELLIDNTFFEYFMFSLSIILIIAFFVTSSDSGSLVVDDLTSGGSKHASLTQKIFWASLEGLLAIFFLLIGGEHALSLIQMLLTIVAGPFAIVLFLIFFLLIYQLIKNHRDSNKKD